MAEQAPPLGPGVQAQLAVRHGRRAVEFYRAAFGAAEVYRFGGTDDHDEVVAQLAVGDQAFWVEDESPPHHNFSPETLGGATGRMLLVAEDPEQVMERAVAAGATEIHPVRDEHGWRLGRIEDPFGHHWEVGRPLSAWPPAPAAGPGEPAPGPEEPGREPEPGTDDPVDLDSLLDLATPWCLRAAATLRIPQHIAAGHRDVADLAEVAGCDRDALHALLGYLVSRGVFHEEAPGRYACNAAATRLAGMPFLDLGGIGGRMAHAWSTTLGYVRTGRSVYRDVFGRPFWEDLAAHPRIAADFDALMGPAGHGLPGYDIELTGGWDEVHSMVDVGGGTGALLASLLQRHPHVRGTLLDLPGTVARAGEILEALAAAGRVRVVGGSFFGPLPAGADLYLLKNVLNDWPDAETVLILRRCAQAASPGGRVVVLGGVSPDDAPPVLAIDMLVAGGKTSTLTRFGELAGEAGLEITASGAQPGGFVVECRPARPEPPRPEAPRSARARP